MDQQLLEMDVFFERMMKLYKVFFKMIPLCCYLIYNQRKMNMYLLCTEALLFSTWYCLRCSDFIHVYKLVISQLTCICMIFYVKYRLGIYLLMCCLVIGFPGYRNYQISCLVIHGIQNIFKYKEYSFPYIYMGFHLFVLIEKYIDFEHKSYDDLPLAGIFCACVLCLYRREFTESDVYAIIIIFAIWVYCKSRYVPVRETEMVPNMEVLNM